MSEIWKDVVGYEGLYQVSNLGNVKSLDREVSIERKDGVNQLRLFKGGKRKLQKNVTNGYMYVNLSKDGKISCKRVHRIVAMAFLSNPKNNPYINHKDGNKTNNRIENLEWCTHMENVSHAINVLKRDYSKGSNITRKKNQKKVIRDDGVIYQSVKDLMEKSNGSNAVYDVLKGRRKRYKGHSYRYLQV